MKFFTMLSPLFLLASSVLAHPSAGLHAAEPMVLAKRQLNPSSTIKDTCGFSSFEGNTSPNSPLVSDCLVIRDWVLRNPGFWAVANQNTAGYLPLVYYGTCQFGVRHPVPRPNGNRVGTDDIAEFITTAAKDFTSDGKLGAEGSAFCTYANGDSLTYGTSIRWAIFHT